MSVVSKIKSLEDAGDLEGANGLRDEWLSIVKFRNSAPLWLSKGNFCFWQEKDYSNALKAFGNASEALMRQPLHYSSINPLDVYYGCTASAIMLNELEKGERYLKKLKEYYGTISNSSNPSNYARSYSERIERLEEQLRQHKSKRKQSLNG